MTLPQIQTFTVSRDDSIYEAWPDVCLTETGDLLCLFSECTHHGNRDYARIMLTRSSNRGRTWSAKVPLTEPTRGDTNEVPYWNCGRLTRLDNGRIVAVIDKCTNENENRVEENYLFISDDHGHTWTDKISTPIVGIVPDQLVELKLGPHKGRWLITAHSTHSFEPGIICGQRLWYSDDQGKTWSDPITIAKSSEYFLCEASIVELPTSELICFMRENSGVGHDAFKSISRDSGKTWSEAIEFPLPGCHRPVSGMLNDGQIMIIHRYMQGGKGWTGWWMQNTFIGLTDVESCLAETRQDAHTRIVPLDYDRSTAADGGYSGWIQFDDGEVYVVNYVVDDAPKAQIRGYAFRPEELVIEAAEPWT
jgi:hypothetical protein